MDIKYLKEIIQIFKESGLESMTIKEKNGGEVTLSAQKVHSEPPQHHYPPLREPPIARHIQEVPPAQSSTIMLPVEEDDVDPKKCVSSPMVGTFYRASSPDSRPYVEVGDKVKEGDTLCIVEAMKVMNEIKSKRAGVVKKILVEEGSSVEYGQHLFVIE